MNMNLDILVLRKKCKYDYKHLLEPDCSDLEQCTPVLHPPVLQVAAHLFQAGANIVKLGIQKTRGSSPDKYLGLY